MDTTHSPDLSNLVQNAVFVRSLPETDAAVRIHLSAAKQAMELYSGIPVTTLSPSSGFIKVGPRTCLIFYYNDVWAIKYIRANDLATKSMLSLCFGSDIRHLPQYQSICDITDCFVMPTRSHAEVLALNVTAHVGVVRELVDPIAEPSARRPDARRDRSMVWFGYAEGYHRSMECFAPIIRLKQEEGSIDRYALVTNRRRLDPRALPAEVIEFHVKTFQSELEGFSYAVLSHAPCDLHINSYIKSPNKLITALRSGLAPLATATPNYVALMEMIGLGRFLFASPREFSRMVDRLDPDADQMVIAECKALDKIHLVHSLENINLDLADVVIDVLPQIDQIRAFTRSQPWFDRWDGSHMQFGDCLRNIAPAGLRKLRQILR